MLERLRRLTRLIDSSRRPRSHGQMQRRLATARCRAHNRTFAAPSGAASALAKSPIRRRLRRSVDPRRIPAESLDQMNKAVAVRRRGRRSPWPRRRRLLVRARSAACRPGKSPPAAAGQAPAKGGRRAGAGAGSVTVEAVKVATRVAAADDHRGRQPALRRIGHAAAGSRRPHQRDRVPGRPARREGRDCSCGSIRRSTQAEVAAGARQPDAREDQVRPRRRPRQEQLHFGPGEGRGGEQPQGRARRRLQLAEAKLAKMDITRAVLRHHRPALGVGRRLREGRRRPRQPRVDRSAEGRLPRARDLHAAGAGRPAAAGARSTRCPARRSRARCSRSIR